MNTFTVLNSKKLTECRICGSSDLSSLIDLGVQPPSNSFLLAKEISKEKKFPLNVLICNICSLGQLSEVVSEEEIFSSYAYKSSSSRALYQSFKNLADGLLTLSKNLNMENALLYDIGCNDGLSLQQYDQRHFRVIGVEPASASRDAATKGFKVYQEFFSSELAQRLAEEAGRADFITTSNVLAHVPNILDFIEGIEKLLKPNGVWVIEFPYLYHMLEQNCFDTIYHEHMSYLSINPLCLAFRQLNLEIFDIKSKEVGGSGPYLQVYVKKQNDKTFRINNSVSYYTNLEKVYGIQDIVHNEIFSKKVYRLAQILKSFIEDIHKNNSKIGAFGAPAKGNTLLNTLNLDSNMIIAAADNTPEKIGLITPGTHIPIVSDSTFLEMKIDTALLLSWNYLEYFKENSQFFQRGGNFILPFPYTKLIRRKL